MKYDSKTKTMDYTKKERDHVFSSFPKKSAVERMKSPSARSKALARIKDFTKK